MKLVIHNGVQYDADNLPKGVNPADCVPADEWFEQNRVTAGDRPAPAPAQASESDDIAGMKVADMNDLIDHLGVDVDKSLKADVKRAALAAAGADLEALAGLDDADRAALAEAVAAGADG
jgi:hypothetical protein